MGSGIVYVVHNNWIKNPDVKKGCKTYKIGKTKNSVRKRYSQMDGKMPNSSYELVGLAMPSEFVCDFAYEFDSEQYHEVEKGLQNILDQSRVGGEWFDLNDKALEGIKWVCEKNGGKLITNTVQEKIEEESVARTHKTYTRDVWIEESKWTVEIADYLLDLISGEREFRLKYTRHHIAFVSDSSNKVCFRIHDRTKNKTVMFLEDCDELRKILDKNNIKPEKSKEKPWMIALIKNKQFVEKHKDMFIEIANFVIGKKQRRKLTKAKEQPKEIETLKTTFKKLGIKVGTELVYKNDEAIKVKTVDEKNRVEYRGEEFTISNVSRQLTGNSTNGYKYFKYNGKVLDDIRRKKYPN